MKPQHLVGAALCAAVVVLGIGVYQYEYQAPYTAPASTSSATTAASQSAATATPSSVGSASSAAAQTYTMAQVEQHDSATSCWSAINGSVYDLTNWIGQHPGGPEHILAICGTDGSASFNAQHAGNAQVESILQQFYLGKLAS